MLENPDEIGPNFVLLLILAEQLQRLRDIFEAAEVRKTSSLCNSTVASWFFGKPHKIHKKY
ncbi:hypothetical protein E8A45_18325 [Salmonella enterica]|nr:hypothetical protein [Salmonella enterica]EBB6123914.1 hypothetical protein [Salmonella enterica]EBW1593010.1 hypothetical protein [Salmonella enterica subsp. diarizonae serovar 61:r:z]ECJ0282969.1 hypothetical protein [Salmonella enterica]